MTFFPNAPAPSDNISVSQGQLQSNNQFLANNAGQSTNGFYVLPSGLTIMWGHVVNSNSSPKQVTFPNGGFTNPPYSIQVTNGRATGSLVTTNLTWVADDTITATSFYIINNDGHTWDYFWLAIGV